MKEILMKMLLLALTALTLSQAALAATPDEVVSSFENSRAVTCKYTRSSSMQICFNTVCEHTEYYSCGDQRLVLKVRSVNYPDGSAVEKVVDSSVGGF
jgi:hypothetical protein